MGNPKRCRRFELMSIPAFDARRGYRRCSLPGIGVSFGDRPRAVADFWRQSNGELVTRLSSGGYVYHMRASLRAGGRLRDEEMEAFSDWMQAVLVEWMIDGVDDVPGPAV